MARGNKFTKDELYSATKQLLINFGYAGFHFGLLAEKLNVSRSAIYKYYKNKNELIIEFMNEEMSGFLQELRLIEQLMTFEEQFDYLLSLIFKYSDIHQILRFIFQIPKTDTPSVNAQILQLKNYHVELYQRLHQFIQKGHEENLLHTDLPPSLILGFIFQTVNIPNDTSLPEDEWKKKIKKFLYYGMKNK